MQNLIKWGSWTQEIKAILSNLVYHLVVVNQLCFGKHNQNVSTTYKFLH